MKKIIIILVVLIFAGYIVLQNGPRWALKLLSLSSDGSGVTTSSPASSSGVGPPYKDGTYTGSTADAFYGPLQIKAMISGGKISDVQFLQYPSDRSRSMVINTLAMPQLKNEAIQAQSANVTIVSGATDSSNAFMQSLASALSQAK